MAVTCREKFKGVTFDDSSAEVKYIVDGTIDEIAARNEIETTCPVEFDGMPLTNISIAGQIKNGMWEGSAHYSWIGPQEPTYIQYAFEIGSGSQHITQSLNTEARFPASAPDNKGVIGVDSKGKVKGVDILIPQGTWSETQYFGEEEITTEYKRLLRGMVGTVNESEFKGDAPGECLFLGAAGSRITKAQNNPGARGERWTEFFWEMQFRFATSANTSAEDPIIAKLKSGDVAVTKEGWQYIWYLYETTKIVASEDEPARMIQQPVAVYVENVYRLADFAALDIGTT